MNKNMSKKKSYGLIKKLKVKYNLYSNLRYIGATTIQTQNELIRLKNDVRRKIRNVRKIKNLKRRLKKKKLNRIKKIKHRKKLKRLSRKIKKYIKPQTFIYNIISKVEWLESEYMFWTTEIINITTNMPLILDIIRSKTYINNNLTVKYSYNLDRSILINIINKYDNLKHEAVIRNLNIQNITLINNSNMNSINMRETKYLQYKLLKQLGIQNNNSYNNECVIDYIFNELSQLYKNLNKQTIRNQFSCNISNGINTNQIKDLIKTYYPYIGFRALDPFLNTYNNMRPTKDNKSGNNRILTFINNNNHLYPITLCHENRQIKRLLTEGKYKFRNTNILKIDQYEDYEFIPYKFESYGKLSKTLDMNDNKLKIVQLIKGTLKSHKIYLIDCTSILDLVFKISSYTNKMIEYLDIKNGNIINMYHPDGDYIIEASPDYLRRKNINAKLYKLFNTNKFIMKNQSYCSIAQNIFENIKGKIIIKNFYNDRVRDIVDNYYLTPLIQNLNKLRISKNENNKSISEYTYHCFDHKKSYMFALENNNYDIPIFNSFDDLKPFTINLVQKNKTLSIGYYLILKTFIYKNFEHRPGIYPNFLMEKYIDDGILKYTDIKYYVKSSQYINLNTWKKFIRFLKKHFKPDEYKSIFNPLTGFYNTKYNKSDMAVSTSDINIAISLFNKYNNEKHTKIGIITQNGITIIRKIERHRKMEDLSSVYNHIIALGYLNMYYLMDELYDNKKSELYGYNTDSIYISNPIKNKKYESIFNNTHQRIKRDKFELPRKRNYIKTEIKIKTDIKEWSIQNLLYPLNKDFYNKSMLVSSLKPGCNKTQTAAESYNESTLCLSFQNTAVENLKNRISQIHNIPIEKINCQTFDSHFRDSIEISKKYNKIIIDEIFNTPYDKIQQIYKLWLASDKKLIIQCYGDYLQIPPVQGCQICYYEKNINCIHGKNTKNKWYDYRMKYIFKEMCGYNKIMLQYDEKTSRFDKDLNNLHTHFLEHKKILNPIDSIFNSHINESLKLNICYTNKLKNKINHLFFNNNPEAATPTQWRELSRVIGKANYKKNGMLIISNSTIYKARYENKEFFIYTQNNWLKISIGIFNSYLEPVYAITADRSQGKTFNENYNIRESKKMSFQRLNVAMTRASKCKFIHIDYEIIKDKIFIEDTPKGFIQEVPILKPRRYLLHLFIDKNNKLCYIHSQYEKKKLKGHLSDIKKIKYLEKNYNNIYWDTSTIIKQGVYFKQKQVKKIIVNIHKVEINKILRNLKLIDYIVIDFNKSHKNKKSNIKIEKNETDDEINNNKLNKYIHKHSICDDKTKKRYYISWRENTKRMTKRMAYGTKIKEDVLNNMKQFREELILKLY